MKNIKRIIWSILFVMLLTAVPVMAAGKLQKQTFSAKTKAVTMVVDEKLQPTIKNVKQKVIWTSKKPSIVTINSKGQWLAKAKGTATVTGIWGQKTVNIKVTVQAPSLNYVKSTLSVGKKFTLKLTDTNQKVKWTSSDKSVATVNSKGIVAAKKTGTATIKATVLGVTYSHPVTVVSKSRGILQVTPAKTNTNTGTNTSTNIGTNTNTGTNVSYVWLPASGKKYHSINHCGNMNPAKATRVTLAEALRRGYARCSKCF